MLNHMTRTLTRLFIAMVFVAAMSLAALAQTPSPTPVSPTLPVTSPIQDPNFPAVTAQPLPPMPDLHRVGIISSNVLSLSLNDTIRRAIQNNNEIEVARDDV